MAEDGPLFSLQSDVSTNLLDLPFSDNVIEWLFHLYDSTDWRFILTEGGVKREYNDILTISIFKALVLPFLINIPSERALTRLILSQQSLQDLCGFYYRYQPNRELDKAKKKKHNMPGLRTFWHFRHKHKEIYSDRIVKGLISLVLSGKNPNFSLPFVEKINKENFVHKGASAEWTLDNYWTKILISMPMNKNHQSTGIDDKFSVWNLKWEYKMRECKDIDEYRKLVKNYEDERKTTFPKEKRGFIEEVTFPIFVSATHVSGEELNFKIKIPNWLEYRGALSEFQSIKDTRLSSMKRVYSRACNILLIRDNNGEKQILLSRRVGGIGNGNYASPGGKQEGEETLEECAKRELQEETDLQLHKSRPISLYYTHKQFIDRSAVLSVGVFAEDWDGDVTTMEPQKHGGWEWYPLNKLPEPLFEFTGIAIKHYLEGKYPNLSWDDIEQIPEFQPELL